jgi:hypothetical protein
METKPQTTNPTYITKFFVGLITLVSFPVLLPLGVVLILMDAVASLGEYMLKKRKEWECKNQ